METTGSGPAYVYVSGGRGFIGAHLVALLERNGIATVSIDLRDARSDRPDETIDAVGDIRDRRFMTDLFAKFPCDQILDLASFTDVGLSFSEYQRNIDQTRAMVEYCKAYNVRKYIFTSTQFVFRKPNALPSSEEDFAPTEAYGQSKVVSEQLIRAELPPGQWLILRPTYIWGPGLDRFRDGLLYRLAKSQFLISNDPGMRRYYGYVETVAAQTLAFSRLDFSALPQKVYYVTDDAVRLDVFCESLVRAMGVGKAWRTAPALIRLLGRAGSLAAYLGMPAPINAMQARELTTNFPVPAEQTIALTGLTTNLADAAEKTVAWALRDPRFRAAVKGGA